MIKAGKYKIYILELGSFALDAGVVFGLIPAALWRKKLQTDPANRIKMALRAILIVGEDRKILVDNGAGDNLNPKMEEIYKLDYSEHSLEQAFGRLGIEYSEITDVINTHLHFDHCGGNMETRAGHLQPRFPEAKYYVQNEQLE